LQGTFKKIHFQSFVRPNMEPLSPEQEDFGSFVGQTQNAAKDEEAACE
jgi:hypothetical protein